MVTILYSPRFAKNFKKMPRRVQELAVGKTEIFQNNPYDPQLKTHKLHGDLEGYMAFSVNFSYRIIFNFENKKTVKFHTIGNHDIY